MVNFWSFLIGILSSLAAALILRYALDKLNLLFPFRRVLRDIKLLYREIASSGFKPDYIVTVDRNGTIIGAILAGFFGFETVISIATINERLQDGSRSTIISQAHLPRPEILQGKKLLIVICFNDTGTSLETVYRCFSSAPYKVEELRLAALYTSVSPKLKPKYFALEVGRDLKTSVNSIIYKMPWMSREWRHVLASERLADKR